MSKQIQAVVALIAALAIPAVANAGSVKTTVFDFTNPAVQTALDGMNGPTSYAVNGLTGFFTESSGALEVSGVGLGIDSGVGTADEVDPGETLSITFDRDVTITVMSLDVLTTDEGIVSIGGVTQTPNLLVDQGAGLDVVTGLSYQVPAGVVFAITSTAIGSGEGFTIANFTATTTPEPSTFLLTTAGVVGLCLRRRRRR
ncbi:MAG: PEP-CTERM sorting domain-containing protein [Planctomycetales bacterium]|nr:PEP-CTERM sorting domain-containing protein [Planctomycetales bacterium]